MMAISQAVKRQGTVTKKKMGDGYLAGVLSTKKNAAVKIGTDRQNAYIDGGHNSVGLLFYIGWYYVYWQKNEWSTHMSQS